jgi:glycosyltransferase involved in cell wall biosynthesis
MRVFMLGWEFPPFISGGLGTACYGLTKAMSSLGTDILFVLPRPVAAPFSTHVRVVSPGPSSPLAAPATEFRLDEFEHVTFRTIDALITSPYQTLQVVQRVEKQVERKQRLVEVPAESAAAPAPVPATAPAATTETVTTQGASAKPGQYSGDLVSEVQRYAMLATEVARGESFDVVHAHDWMTFPAGMAVAALKGVPLVVHVHSTEFDRAGSNIDSRIYDIERRGMHAAMKVIAVSYLTRATVMHHYGVDSARVEVVYNAIEQNGNGHSKTQGEESSIRKGEKIVLFLGRITLQKGPEYFLAAARKVLDVMPNVKFVMAGSGDLTRRTIEMANQMGIGDKVLFTGFLRGTDVERVFRMADLYVMPSVSEPFGIAPLEAMNNEVPVIISKQSGVSEVLNHVLKVDFWDVDEMANKIVAVLKHPPLARTLREEGNIEVKRLNWADAAKRCVELYEEAVGMVDAPKATLAAAPDASMV